MVQKVVILGQHFQGSSALSVLILQSLFIEKDGGNGFVSDKS